MADLETVVRPSQAPGIRPAAVLGMFSKPKVTDSSIHTWGTAGNTIFQLQASLHSEIKGEQNEEISRKYDVVRIKNPDDTTQHVDVNVMTEYEARNKIDKSRTTMRFALTTANSTTEILQRGVSATGSDT